MSGTGDSGNSGMKALTAWADSVGVSRRTAVHWATTGVLPAFRIGRRWFVLGDALGRLAAQGSDAGEKRAEHGCCLPTRARGNRNAPPQK